MLEARDGIRPQTGRSCGRIAKRRGLGEEIVSARRDDSDRTCPPLSQVRSESSLRHKDPAFSPWSRRWGSHRSGGLLHL